MVIQSQFYFTEWLLWKFSIIIYIYIYNTLPTQMIILTYLLIGNFQHHIIKNKLEYFKCLLYEIKLKLSNHFDLN